MAYSTTDHIMPSTNARLATNATESDEYSWLPHIYQKTAIFIYFCSTEGNTFAWVAISDLSSKQADCQLVYYAIRVITRLYMRARECGRAQIHI